jgi:hypothetical protein
MTKQHRIAQYHYAIDVGGGYGRLSLSDAEGRVVGEISFIEDGRALPNPKLDRDLSHGIGFMAIGHMAPLVDMLRHEHPVYLVLDDEPPGFFSLRTGTPQEARPATAQGESS